MDPFFVRACDKIYLACIWMAGAAIFLMSLIIPWGVFTRYVLGTGSQWPEPVAILFMMVFTFIGAAAAYRAGAHIAVAMLTDTFPAGLRKAAAVLVDLLMVLVCAFVAWYGTQLCIATWHQSVSELTWLPVGVTYAQLPIGALATLAFVIERMAFGSQSHRPVVRFDEAVEPEGAR
ncbi:MAG: TRAP transporter small permease [Gammaproteobacteria bacterium]|nr:TRAP transporter small permease [Gammaproteobacteria bacterium]